MIITMPESDQAGAEVRSYNCTPQDMYAIGDRTIYACTWDDEDSHGTFLLIHQKGFRSPQQFIAETWKMSSGLQVEVMV